MLSVWKCQIWKSFHLTIGGSASRDAMLQQLFSHHVFNVMEPTPQGRGVGWGEFGVRSARVQRQALRVALLEKRRANAISSADRSRWGCCRIVAPSGTPGAETTRALASLSPLFSQIAPPASVYTMCGELPHCAAHVPPQSWGDVGRKIPRGEGRTRVCYPHEWHQSVPHAHGVLRTAGWACPRDLRAVRAAHPSARGPRKGRARTPSSLSGYHSKPNQIVRP